MFRAIRDYFAELCEALGRGWNEFWFTPQAPHVLGLMRVLLGMIALYVVGSYAPDLQRLFGPEGMLSLDTLRDWEVDQPWRVSFLRWIRSPGGLWTAHVASLLVLALYTLGVWTRVTSVLAWGVVLSYIHRGPMLTGMVEPVLAMAMFYLCLGPCGAWLSVDAWRRGTPPPESVAANISLRLLQLHVALVYLMMGVAKLYGDVWLTGDAVWWLATRPESRWVDLTRALEPHPFVVQAWSHLVLAVELLFGILIWNRLARPLLLLSSAVVWLSLLLVLGDFPFVFAMLTVNLAFVSGMAVRSLLAGSWERQTAVARADV